MSNKTSTLLLNLAEADKNLLIAKTSKADKEAKIEGASKKVAEIRQALEKVEQQHTQAKEKHSLEEQKHKDEEKKIVERRKQLSEMGGISGAKSAKIIERDIETASKALKLIEERVFKASEEVELQTAKLKEIKEQLQGTQEGFESLQTAHNPEIEELDKEIQKEGKNREKIYTQLEDRQQRLYHKVHQRYPGDPVAIASNGSCRSCYRSLPAQLYNQILIGNTFLQCPGCFRILVTLDKK